MLAFFVSARSAFADNISPLSQSEQIEREHIVLKRCKGFAEQVTRKDVVYVIQHSFNLRNKTVTIPEGCTLIFNGGSIKNGSLVGQHTNLEYNKPFLNFVTLRGSFICDTVPVDSDIFIDKIYDTGRIRSLLCIYGKENRVVFSKNTYKNVETIRLTRNVDIDFSGSTIKLRLEQGGLPNSFIFTEERKANDKSFLDSFKLKNATIIGNEAFEYDGTVWPKTLHRGNYRRCIQLFKVDEVDIDNVRFEYVEAGTSGDYHKDARERYELSVVAVMYYNNARINACELHDCFGDNLIRLVPNVTADNMAIVSNCTSYRNYTGLVSITDGRCKVFENSCKDFNSSAMNLFVYESDIYNNYFENSLRSDCIDLSEDGTRVVHDVNIHDNTGVDIGVFCSVCGDRINVYNNHSKTKGTASLVWVDGTRQPNASLVNNNVGLRTLRVVKIFDNEVVGGGIVSSGVNSAYNTLQRYIDTLYVENNTCEKVSEIEKDYTHPVFLFNCKKAIIRGNRMKGLSKNPAGKGSAAFICSFNVIPESATFNNDVEIVGNTFDFDAGTIGVNALKAMYLLRNSREDKNFDIKVDAHDNTITGADRPLREVYISSGIGKKRIQAKRNVGTIEQYKRKEMVIDSKILDEQTEAAKANPRLRQAMDLRNSPEDLSQRTLNALEPGTVMPIHRHKCSSETCVCIRGHFEEYLYDENGNLTETVDMVPGGVILNIEKGQWHSLRCLDSGTILLERWSV